MIQTADPQPLVSIVMLSYNRLADVVNGLEQLHLIAYEKLEFIVVDNASSDGTCEQVRRRFPDVKLIRLDENLGVAAANRGFFSAAGEFIVIIDDDSYPLPEAIARMVQCFQSDEKIGIVAFNVRNVSHFQAAAQEHEKTEQSVPPCQLGFNGAGAGFRRSVLEKVGGYSPAFFLYWNELDLALRVVQAGFTIHWDERIIALHQYSPQNRDSLRAPFYYTRNLFWLYWQYWPLLWLCRKSLSFFFSCVYHSLEQKTLVYVRAYIAALAKLKRVPRKPMQREIIKSLRMTEKLAFIYFR